MAGVLTRPLCHAAVDSFMRGEAEVEARPVAWACAELDEAMAIVRQVWPQARGVSGATVLLRQAGLQELGRKLQQLGRARNVQAHPPGAGLAMALAEALRRVDRDGGGQQMECVDKASAGGEVGVMSGDAAAGPAQGSKPPEVFDLSVGDHSIIDEFEGAWDGTAAERDEVEAEALMQDCDRFAQLVPEVQEDTVVLDGVLGEGGDRVCDDIIGEYEARWVPDDLLWWKTRKVFQGLAQPADDGFGGDLLWWKQRKVFDQEGGGEEVHQQVLAGEVGREEHREGKGDSKVAWADLADSEVDAAVDGAAAERDEVEAEALMQKHEGDDRVLGESVHEVESASVEGEVPLEGEGGGAEVSGRAKRRVSKAARRKARQAVAQAPGEGPLQAPAAGGAVQSRLPAKAAREVAGMRAQLDELERSAHAWLKRDPERARVLFEGVAVNRARLQRMEARG